MPEWTTKELSCIQELLGQEEVLVKKFQFYAQLTDDPQLRSKCEQIASRHQNHYNKLLCQLGQ